jgi:hypothetical protein
MFENPPTAYYGLPPAPFKERINNVALPIGIPVTRLRVIGFHSLLQDVPQRLRVGGGHAQRRGEDPCFVFPLIMQGIEAVIA